MKYIRTKEHLVCKVINIDDRIISYDSPYVNGVLWKEDFKGKYKIADTIEELCDCFVSVRDKYHDIWDNFEEARILCSESDVFGAIWTDKGLFYVARMNENGELELI